MPPDLPNSLTDCDVVGRTVSVPGGVSSRKNGGDRTASLPERTAEALRDGERRAIGGYGDTDTQWLTSHGSAHGSESRRRSLQKLREKIGIETANRKTSRYPLRHGPGTHLTKERDVAATRAQLLHEVRDYGSEAAPRDREAMVADEYRQ